MPDAGFRLQLVCPQFQLAFDEVGMAVIPGVEGDFGVMPRHAPMLSMLRPGVVEVHAAGGETQRIFVRDGFAEVLSGDVTLLAEEIVELEKLDAADLAQQIQNAKEDVADAKDDEARETAQAALERLEQLGRAAGVGASGA